MSFHLKMKSSALLLLAFSGLLGAAPRLSLSSNTVGPVNTIPGANGPAQTVQALNPGDGTLNLTATSSASWLSATIGVKGTCAGAGGNCYAVNIALNTSSLAAGVYSEFITLSDPNAVDAPQDIAVTVNTNSVPASIAAFVAPSGSGGPSSAIFNLFTSGTGIQGTVATQSGGPWLSFQPGSNGLVTAVSPWLIQVKAQPGQAAGTYTGTVTITGSSVASDNKTTTVTMTVTSAPIIQLDNPTTVRITAYPGGPAQPAYPILNNIGLGTLAVTGVTGSVKFLTGSVLSPNQLALSADPAGLAPGLYPGTVTLTSNAANNAQTAIRVELLVVPAGAPMISAGGLVNAANFANEAASPGDIVALFGSQLAAAGTSAQAAAVPLSVTLGSAQVLVNGVPAPLYYVSPGQINFQLPYSLTPGQPAIVKVVTNGNPGNSRSLAIAAIAPRVLVAPVAGNYGIVVNNGDGSLALPVGTFPGSHPARPGDNLVFYAVGFGQTSPAAVEGAAAGANGLQSVPNVIVTFGVNPFGGNQMVNAAFAGLTPTAVGLYQVNVTVPPNAPVGPSVQAVVNVNGVLTNLINIAISASGR